MSEERQALKNFLDKKNFPKTLEKLSKKYEGKNIIAYGTGQLAQVIVENYDISGLNIIGFADSKYLNIKEDFHNYKTFSPNEVQELNPDVIMLFVLEPKYILQFFEFYYPEFENVEKVKLVEKTFWDKLFGR